MDGNKFKEGLLWWFSEVSKVSTGPRLLLLDNCGGHDARLSLPRVRIEFLSPGNTAVHQPLYMGIIAATKIKYRYLLLTKNYRQFSITAVRGTKL